MLETEAASGHTGGNRLTFHAQSARFQQRRASRTSDKQQNRKNISARSVIDSRFKPWHN